MNIVIIIFLILTLLNGVLYHTLELTVRGYIAIISDRGYRLEVFFFFFFFQGNVKYLYRRINF